MPTPAVDIDGPAALPRLVTVDNFRDIAGPDGGYPVPGGRMRPGVLFRSNRLEPSPADHNFLQSLGLTAIHDLRQDYEVERHPDSVIEGAQWRHHVVPGIPEKEVQSLTSAEQCFDAMIENYRTFVSDPACRAGLSSVLAAIAATDGPQLFHCAAGKDRTGWAALLLQHIAGAGWDSIRADYHLTDEYSVASRQATLDSILEKLGEDVVPAFEPAFRCDDRYLDTAVVEADRLYGGLDGYLRDGLGLAPDVVEAIRSRIVETD
ncbi:tyrosine-protein phosphatase [Mycolicibacterium neoaurum]|uniref:tyrosine-protein phosphatase n=1 Tax=Mycolicibacterium neoaurum TaxID=1795 RepID=UPI002671BEE0|nr:tyrosine-protein phosphatase [Mycolicibacterium neoaurum]MDO3402773.1 tyrosine-protein phosphatase [Mycolicibacterium neoaurum]